MLFLLRLACIAPPIMAGCSSIQADETVLLFPTAGWPRAEAEGGGWEIEIHGWVFEHELSQSLIERVVGEIDAIEEGPDAAPARVAARVRPFLVDNQSGKRVTVRVAGQTDTLGPTPANGHFIGTVTRSDEAVSVAVRAGEGADAGVDVGSGAGASADRARSTPQWIDTSVVLPPGDDRRFAGRVLLVHAEGLSVISDVDDTILHTGVFKEAKAALRAVLLRPHRPVEGMAAAYRGWAERHHAAFHYVSHSPWPRYEALAEFIAEHGFPAGAFQLRPFRLVEQGVEALWNPSQEYKPEQIDKIMARWPRRRFVLVGDSAERDPEIYGEAARKRPQQIVAILIRDMTAEPEESERYRKAFENIPRSKWRVFQDPREIADAVD